MIRRARLAASTCAVAGLLAVVGAVHPANAYDSVVIMGAQPGYFQGITSPLTTNADANKDAVNQQLQNQTDRVVEALRLHSTQQTITLNAGTQAQAQMNDVRDARETQRSITDWRMRGTTQAVPGASVCNVITGNVSTRSAYSAVSQWRSEISDQMGDFHRGDSPNTAARQGAAAALDQRVARHCAVGASDMDVQTGLCSTKVDQSFTADSGNVVTPASPRDLNADILLNPPSLTLSAKERDLANSFILQAFESAPLGAVASAKDELGRRAAALALSSTAQSSVASGVVAAILADHAALPGTGGTGGTDTNASTGAGTTVTNAQGTTTGAVSSTIRSWAEGTAKDTIGYNHAPGAQNFPNGVSEAAGRRLRASGWYWSPNWAVSVGSGSDSTNLKEIALMTSYGIWQRYEAHGQLERLNLTMAQILSIMEERNRPVAGN